MYQQRLQKITGWSNTTEPKVLVELCGYLQWADLDQLELNFEYEEVDLKYCDAICDSKLYFKGYGHSDLW